MRMVEHVFLRDNAHNQSPYLFETSKRARASIEYLDFCKDSIIFPKIETTQVLKTLKEISFFVEDGTCSMLEKSCGILATQRDLVEKETCCSKLSAHMMIRCKINKSIKIVGKPSTCHDSCARSMILKNTNENLQK